MKQTDRPFLVAITGGIGAGKSTVCKHIQTKGFTVIYTDLVADKIRNLPQNVAALTKKFGNEILDGENISIRKLGEIVFTDTDKLKFLNNLLHPLVYRELQHKIDISTKDILFFEIPLLFENNLESAFDLTINISADLHNKIERIEHRSGISRAEILRRISSQMADEEKKKRADITLENNLGLKEIINKTNELLDKIHKFPYKQIQRIGEL